MGATPIAGHRHEGEPMPQLWRNDTPVAAPRRESAAWGYVVHPSLMPTVFAPSGSAAASGTVEEVAARRV
jgi:hypothetical protein